MTGQKVVVVVSLWLLLPGLLYGQLSNQRVGMQLNAGLGITGGRNIEKDLMEDNVNPDLFDSSTGVSLRFGLTARIRIVENLYIEPELLLSFYGQKAQGNNVMVQLTDGTVAFTDYKANWSNSDIAFGAGPVYYVRIKNFPVHPFLGMGVRLRFFSSGDVKGTIQFKDPQLTPLNQTTTIKASEAWSNSSITTMALAFKTGFEFVLPGNMAIPLTFSYELNFSSFVNNVFRIQTGFAFYF